MLVREKNSFNKNLYTEIGFELILTVGKLLHQTPYPLSQCIYWISFSDFTLSIINKLLYLTLSCHKDKRRIVIKHYYEYSPILTAEGLKSPPFHGVAHGMKIRSIPLLAYPLHFDKGHRQIKGVAIRLTFHVLLRLGQSFISLR